jgi:integrase
MARYTATDPDTGLSIRKALYGRTEQEARAKLIGALKARQDGTLVVGRGRQPTLAEYARRWIASSQRRIRPRTLHRYEELLRAHLLPRLGKIQLVRLEPRHLNAVMVAMHEQGLSPRTVNYARQTLRALLNEAMREALVGRNVAQLVRPLPNQDHRVAVLTPEQISILLKAAERDRDGPLWIVAIATGARQSELFGLRWKDVDLAARRLSIVRTLQFQDGVGWLVQPCKTERSRRWVPLPEIAVEALHRQRHLQAMERLESGPRWSEELGDLVFRAPGGAPEKSTTVTQRFQRRLEKLGLPRVGFHSLRHSAASTLAAAGVPLRSVSELLGHSQLSTTSDLYVHIFEQAHREVAIAMDRALQRGRH